MGKKLALLALCGALASCGSDNPPVIPGGDGTLYKRSYVQSYCDGEFYATLEDNPQDYLPITRRRDNVNMHYSPEWVETTIVPNQETGNFVEYATANNDLSYNRQEERTLLTASADNFKEVHIVCPEANWDVNHPAGRSLNDITTLTVTSYAKFIRNNYQGETSEIISKLVSEYTEADLAVLKPAMKFSFEKMPEKSGKYALMVTLITTEGKELRVAGHINVRQQ